MQAEEVCWIVEKECWDYSFGDDDDVVEAT